MSQNSHTGNSSIYNNYESGQNTNYLVTEGYLISDGANDLLSFWYFQDYTGNYGYSGVWISTSSDDPIANPGDFIELQEFDSTYGFSEDTWSEYTMDLSSYEGKTVYIAFKYSGGNYAHQFYIDDFSLSVAPSCLAPSALAATGITSNSANLSWTENENAAVWDIDLVSPGELPSDTPDYSGVTSNPYNAINLSTGTNYEFYVRSHCSDGTFSSWVGPHAFMTDCAPMGAFSENFDGVTDPELPNCWSAIVDSDSDYARVETSSYFSNSGPNSLYLYSNVDISAELYAITPQLADLPAGTHWLRFMARSDNDAILEIGTMSDPTDASTFTLVKTLSTTGDYQEFKVPFDAGTSDTYIAFRGTFTGYYKDSNIDDIVWEPIPTCLVPTDLAATVTSLSTADISWAESASIPSGGYEYAVTTSATPPASGTGTTNTSVTGATIFSSVENFLHVRANCGEEDGFSKWTTFSFMGPIPGQIGLVEEGFSLPIQANFYYNYSQQLYLASELNIALEGGTTYITKIRFYYETASNSTAKWDNWTIYMGNTSKTSFDSASDWVPGNQLTKVFSGNLTVPEAGNWMEIELTTGFMWDGTSSLVIAVDENVYDYNYGAAFGAFNDPSEVGRTLIHYSDDTNADPASPPEAQRVYSTINTLQLETGTPPSCLAPSALTATGITSNSAELGWTESEHAAVWDIDLVSHGELPSDTPDYSGVTSNPYNAINLSTGTDYEFYVRSHCSDGTFSSWTGPYAFMTDCGPIGAFSENFDGATTPELPNCWSVIVNSDGDGVRASYVEITTYPSNSDPNNLELYTYRDISAELYAITPQLADLPAGTHWLRFTARTDPGAILEIGTMSDPTDASTFTLVQTLSTTSNYQKFRVPFDVGTSDTYIAFKGTYTDDYKNSNIDDIVWEPIPACIKPINVVLTDILATTANFSWDAIANATNGYDWYVYKDGEDPETATIVASGTTAPGVLTAQVTGLAPNNQYEFYVASNCGSTDGGSRLADPVGFFIGYCASVPDGYDNNGITNIKVGNTDFNSENKNEYQDYTGSVVHLQPNMLANVQITFDTHRSYDTNIWIDLNDNLVFEPSELLYSGVSSDENYETTLNASFTMPATAPFGKHRMRIGSADNGQDPPNPCYNRQYGVTADFTVNILGDYIYADGSWAPNPPNVSANPATTSDDISVLEGTPSFTSDIHINSLGIASGATLNIEQALTVNGKIINDGNLVFVNGVKTVNEAEVKMLGQLGNMTGSTITGNGTVTVQRYIPKREIGEDRINGAYRYITSAVTTTGSIHANWQEDGVNDNGFGMLITGPGGDANGFDTTEANVASMLTWNNVDQEFKAVTNTDQNGLMAGVPYAAYVWGNRSLDIVHTADGNDPEATDATLRATGSLKIGDQDNENPFSEVSGDYNFVGNPYQAIVDMGEILPGNTTNLNPNFYYVWDPNLGANGAYVAVDPDDGSKTPSTSAANQYLQPGQAVFVKTLTNGPASILFQESDKHVTADPTDVFKPQNMASIASIELQLFRRSFFSNGGPVADAFKIEFSEEGSNAVLPNDAAKLYNPDENLGLVNGDELLMIANRALPTDGENLQVFNNNYRTDGYVYKAVATHLPAGTKAYLHDNYLNTDTELANDGETLVNFSVDETIPASIAMDRFSIVFSKKPLSVDGNLMNGFSIYPNPVENNEFFILTTGIAGEKVRVSLYNLLGQQVYKAIKKVGTDDRILVKTSNLETGIYFVEMAKEGKTITKKLLVE